MTKTQKHLFTFSLVYLFTFSFALADNQKIEIESGTNKFKDLVFAVPSGSQHTGELVVHNKGNEDVDVVLFIAPDKEASLVESMKAKKGNDLFFKTLFYFDAPPEKYKELLKNNNGEITALCDKYEDSDDKALKKWCEGDRSTTMTIGAGESKRVPFTVNISSDSNNHQAYVTAVLEDKYDDKVLAQEKLTYKIPVKELEIDKVKFESFSFKRSFSLMNVFSWWKAGKREEHVAEFVVSNNDSLDVNHEVFIKMGSGEENIYKLNVTTDSGKTETYNINVPMPWFGKVEIVGGIRVGEGEKVHEFTSEKIKYFIIPVREIILVLLVMTGLLILMWKKKEGLNNVIGGSSWVKYRIKQGENIMSIAYRYGTSWKALVYKNNIKPPYTLIVGNVIMVPPRPKKVFKNTFMQNKNNLDNLMDDREVRKKSFSNSNGVKIDVKGETSEHTTQMPEKSHSEKRTVNGMGVKQSSGSESTEASMVQRQEHSENRRVQRNGVRNERRQHFANGRERRNIDIKWMHEDDETFSEAMQDEVKAINFKIKIFILVILVLIGLVTWWFLNYGVEDESPRSTASINDLLNTDSEENEEDNKEQSESGDDGQQTEDDNADNEGGSNNEADEEDNDDSSDQEGESENVETDDSVSGAIKKPAEISVQVLNGGAKPGIAGDLTNIFKNKLYTTKSATNANNNVDGVMVYYKSGLSKEATVLSKTIPQVYGSSTLEESDDVARKYGVDVIVVVGK